ncbi:DUF2252 domain-containing protein [Chitinophaga sp. Cy-1792]|uniref:DUF2252 domain-containing protein n=1 Tax=Chitinophaga sp. Cy-1792 TaxID=2608339 RepID=UPI0014219AC1|nr:DUF2252 family protein [Chitinophaga sp. Cy-1792]NIG53178.1 DUF2252 domain-containing protein [Chitinophaga sp. Cy-1792]
MENVVSRIVDFNKGRIPEMLQLKYAAMRQNPFRFFRGSCHLFYEDLPAESSLLKSPMAWICGDMHLENFGSYKADNHIPYFDINDFDESILAPCLVDPARLLCSGLVASDVLGINTAGAKELFNIFMDAYMATLSAGYIRSLEKQAATGTIKQFLDTVKNRSHDVFMSKRMYFKDKKPKLIIDGVKTLKAPPEEKHDLKTALQHYMEDEPRLSKMVIKDIAYRIAGTGSLGGYRYIILVTYKDVYYLLDLKEALPSCILQYHDFPQPKWKNEADRVTEVQKRIQAASPALLRSVEVMGKHYILKSLQPSADKLDFQLFNGNIPALKEISTSMGQICAWDCLRSGGRQGSAIADELIAFAKTAKTWKPQLYDYVKSYAVKVNKDFKVFAAAYDKKQLSS